MEKISKVSFFNLSHPLLIPYFIKRAFLEACAILVRYGHQHSVILFLETDKISLMHER